MKETFPLSPSPSGEGEAGAQVRGAKYYAPTLMAALLHYYSFTFNSSTLHFALRTEEQFEWIVTSPYILNVSFSSHASAVTVTTSLASRISLSLPCSLVSLSPHPHHDSLTHSLTIFVASKSLTLTDSHAPQLTTRRLVLSFCKFICG